MANKSKPGPKDRSYVNKGEKYEVEYEGKRKKPAKKFGAKKTAKKATTKKATKKAAKTSR